MRYNREHKERSRHRILFSAARLMRKHGIGNVSIAQVMADAGLTHGAFYAHFSSKDDLAEQAMASALNDSFNRLRDTLRKGAARGEPALQLIVDFYLSEQHLESPWGGCALSCVAQEVVRGDAGGREAMLAALDDVATLVAPHMPGEHEQERSARARSLYAALVGVVTLARLHRTPAQRLAQLEAGRQQILQSFGTRLVTTVAAH